MLKYKIPQIVTLTPKMAQFENLGELVKIPIFVG